MARYFLNMFKSFWIPHPASTADKQVQDDKTIISCLLKADQRPGLI
jgi:hypothetical protein